MLGAEVDAGERRARGIGVGEIGEAATAVVAHIAKAHAQGIARLVEDVLVTVVVEIPPDHAAREAHGHGERIGDGAVLDRQDVAVTGACQLLLHGGGSYLTAAGLKGPVATQRSGAGLVSGRCHISLGQAGQLANELATRLAAAGLAGVEQDIALSAEGVADFRQQLGLAAQGGVVQGRVTENEHPLVAVG